MAVSTLKMVNKLTFLSIPVFVSDSHTRYFLFDIHFQEKYNEESLLLVTRLLSQLRQEFNSDKNNIDRVLVQFFESLPFYSFNYFFFSNLTYQTRYSDEGITTLHVGDKSFALSSIENDEILLCMALSTVYFK